MIRLIAFLAGLLVLSTGPAFAGGSDAFTITTQNVKVGMTPAHSRHDIDQAAEHSSIVITQEMDYRAGRDYHPSGWGWAHHGPRGSDRGDCETFWDRAVWRVEKSWVTPISFESFRHGHRWALTTILKNRVSKDELAMVCVHLFTKTMIRRAAYVRAHNHIAPLLQSLKQHYPYVVIGGDWNRNWKDRMRFTGFASRMPPHPTGGNGKGGRIDYFQWWKRTLGTTSGRVIGNTYSDHQGFRVHFEGSVF